MVPYNLQNAGSGAPVASLDPNVLEETLPPRSSYHQPDVFPQKRMPQHQPIPPAQEANKTISAVLIEPILASQPLCHTCQVYYAQ